MLKNDGAREVRISFYIRMIITIDIDLSLNLYWSTTYTDQRSVMAGGGLADDFGENSVGNTMY